MKKFFSFNRKKTFWERVEKKFSLKFEKRKLNCFECNGLRLAAKNQKMVVEEPTVRFLVGFTITELSCNCHRKHAAMIGVCQSVIIYGQIFLSFICSYQNCRSVGPNCSHESCPTAIFLYFLTTHFLTVGLSATHILADWVLDWSLVATWTQLMITDLAVAFPTHRII